MTVALTGGTPSDIVPSAGQAADGPREGIVPPGVKSWDSLTAHDPFSARSGHRVAHEGGLVHGQPARPLASVPRLHDAQLVIAREYGFPSWPRWKRFVETRRLDTGERAAELLRAACGGDSRC